LDSVLQFLNFKTQKIIVSRDITWSNKTNATYMQIDSAHLVDGETTEPINNVPIAAMVPLLPPNPDRVVANVNVI
jgi:hypothetical protein